MKKCLLLLSIICLNSNCTTRSQIRNEIEQTDEDLKVSERALKDQIQKNKRAKRKVIYVDVPVPSREEASLSDFVESEESEDPEESN